MGEHSKIEWTDHTFNPWIGCQKVSPGCDNCYAEAMMDKRYGKVQWGPHGTRLRTSEANWRKPRQWAKAARGTGTRPRVFCASLADVFDNQVPAEWRGDLFTLIACTPELDWLLLTKRPENLVRFWPIGDWPNIWLGVTCEDQKRADQRIPILLDTRAVVRFVSAEPLLERVSFTNMSDLHFNALYGVDHRRKRIDWVIVGGESGHDARRMHPDWARCIRDDCAKEGTAFFMKQMTGKAPIPDDLLVRQFPASRGM